MDTPKEREKEYFDKAFAEGTRVRTSKFYSITQSSRDYYQTHILSNCRGKHVLEYGCGSGMFSVVVSRLAAQVTGIDLSEVAINRARETAEQHGAKKISFHVMDAESLTFADNAFDLICGIGILHHLDLARSFSELARTLKPNGQAIFMEPLNHNPAIRLYRKMTPTLRTRDEHPLVMKDLELAKAYFAGIETRFFYLLALLAVPFRNLASFLPLLESLEAVDRRVFRLVPYMRRHAWTVVMVLSNPKKRR